MRAVLIAFCCTLLIGASFAQSSRGTITGTVGDPAGAMIPGAVIEAKNSETGAVYRAASTETGNYVLGELPVGAYELSASASGFKRFVRTGITVVPAQVLRIDIKLEIGTLNETVTVNADAPLLRTESGDLSHDLAAVKLTQLPTQGFIQQIRNPLSVLTLMPGTQFTHLSSTRVDGAPSNTQSLRIEGQDATNGIAPSSTVQNQASMEAVEEFVVQAGNYAAEYGQAGGGLINMTMKSGTNDYHGTVYDYFSNEDLDAYEPFLKTRNMDRRNDYGFNLSGPLSVPKLYDAHDKTFFFFNFEQFRQYLTYANNYWTMPTAAMRAGNFSQILTGRQLGTDPLGRPIMENAIYDPGTEHIVNGQIVRDPFPNNIIPSSRFDPVAVKIQNLVPAPTTGDLTNNYLVPWQMIRVQTNPALKIDQNLGSKIKVSFYYSSMEAVASGSLGPPGGDGINSPITTDHPVNTNASTYRLSVDDTLSPTTLLHLGAGYQGMWWPDSSQYSSFNQLTELGLSGAYASRFPYITGLSGTLGGYGKPMGPITEGYKYVNKPTANASLTLVKGSHTYKFGGEMRIEGYPITLLNPAYGTLNFGATETGLPSTLGQNLKGGIVGFPYASFLLGLVDSGNIAYPSSLRLGKNAWAVFAQDSWKVTRKLTLDYGLRWDYQTYFQETYDRVANFSPTTPNPSAGGLPGAVIFEGYGPGHCNCDFANVYPYAFGPRLGVAYQVTPQTVLRAGLGILYGQTPEMNQSNNNMGSSNPFSSPAYGEPAMILQNGFPTPNPWPNLNPGQYPFAGQTNSPPIAIDRNAGRPPRQIQWSVGLQRQLTTNLAIEASYVGNRGAWWEGDRLIDVNALTADRIASSGLDVNDSNDRALLTSPLNSALAKQRGFNKPPYAGFPMSSTVAQSLRPFPQFSTINYLWAPLGRTWYDSLQVKVTKRFSHGIDVNSGFTWQKEEMMGSEGIVGVTEGAVVNDVYNRPSNKYISELSRPEAFFMGFHYMTPKLAALPKPVSWLMRNWTYGLILQYASGFPILAPIAQNQLSSVLFRPTFANRVPGQPLFTTDVNCNSCFNAVTNFVLNPKAWVDPPQGQFGNGAAYYNDYRWRRVPDEQMSIGRTFRLKEGMELSLRADFDNAFNRTRLAPPTSANAKATQVYYVSGETQSGFGDINTRAATAPRTGVIIARISF